LTLSTRLSVFFLTMLGLVLIGFSAVFFLLARTYVHRQTEAQLESAVNTLVAAVEIAPDGVEWEPTQRALTFGPGTLGGQIVWLLLDDHGEIVDRSTQPAADNLLEDLARTLANNGRTSNIEKWQGQEWQIVQRWVHPSPEGLNVEADPPGKDEPQKKYKALAVTAAISLEPGHAVLWLTAEVLGGLSVGIWLLALVVSRRVCRRALRPVTEMAVAARGMGADDFDERLPSAATADELEDLSRSFNNLLDRLQESFQRQQRFTGDASHQLRTPLTAILGQIEVALRRERPADEYVRVLNTVRHKALHLRRITESLLFLARADADAHLPELEVVNLADWLMGQLEARSENDRAGDIVFKSTADDSLSVKTQPALLGELLNILVDNACKYSQPGTPIRILLRANEQSAFLTVEDRGAGIAEEDLSQISKPFFRSADSRRRGIEGMGLGLSIAKRLAAALGGDFSFTSEIGQGSSFTVRIPRAQANVVSGGQRAQARPDSPVEFQNEKASDTKQQFIDASPLL
jgi:signal transduction histidine kinase